MDKEMKLPEAERLYVFEQYPLADISERLGVSNRMLQGWKSKQGWDEKRRRYQLSRQSFHEELYEFARDLLRDIREDLAEKRDPGNGKLYTLGRLLGSLMKVKDYESAAKKREKKAGTTLTPEVIKLIEEQIGLDSQE